MGELPGIVVTGVSGRMGQTLVRLIAESENARLVGALERSGHDWVGRDLGAAMGGADLGVVVSDDAAAAREGKSLNGFVSDVCEERF